MNKDLWELLSGKTKKLIRKALKDGRKELGAVGCTYKGGCSAKEAKGEPGVRGGGSDA